MRKPILKLAAIHGCRRCLEDRFAGPTIHDQICVRDGDPAEEASVTLSKVTSLDASCAKDPSSQACGPL
jgi:hypothetical protein